MIRDDEGAVTLYVVITFTALLAALGLVADVGSATVTKGRAIHSAYAAARAGAAAMSAETFATTGHVIADPRAARRASLAYLQSIGAANGATVSVSGNVVHVEVRLADQTEILNLFGLDEFSVTGEGSASAVYGLQEASP